MASHHGPGPQLANVEIGRLIKCRDCGINAFPARFSNKQLNEYRRELLNVRRGKTATLPRCISCTPGNVQELKCQDCREFKPVEDFSRNARSQPDNARCRPCVQATEDLVPDFEEALAEEQIREEYEKHPPGTSVSSSHHGSTSGYSNADYAASDSASQSASNKHGVFVNNKHDSAWDDPPQSTSSSVSPLSTVHSARASTTYSRAPSGSTRGGFSNISAYRPPVEVRVYEQMQRQRQLQQQQQQQSQRDQGNQQARGTATGRRDDSDDEEDSDFEL
ncbi:hypothetical protein B0A52_06131 [Exophiala mesophila]|uniref:Stc1 domain-containing protein n=1 Tax=Exophiala mesophila TaxID=212818 RepID=A0A438N5M2_EXOME|nr:hypothetical protein B0A52_06131 [Exophiala mesophila]